MAQLRNIITTNRLVVQLPPYILKTRAAVVASFFEYKHKNYYPFFWQKMGKIQTFSTVRKSLNTHGTLSVYLLRRPLTVSCFKKDRFGEIVNSGSQSNSKDQSTLSFNIWAAPSEFVTYRLCEQRRFRRACASAQSRQNLRCSLIQTVSQEEPSDRKPDPCPL